MRCARLLVGRRALRGSAPGAPSVPPNDHQRRCQRHLDSPFIIDDYRFGDSRHGRGGWHPSEPEGTELAKDVCMFGIAVTSYWTLSASPESIYPVPVGW